MGYYDFNDHFWSPVEVCVQAPKKQPLEKKFRVTKLVKTVFSTLYRPSKIHFKKANTIKSNL